MKLLARNLARSTTEAELRTLFETFGKVQSCSLVLDKESGISKGFCFIEMPSPGEAKAAVKNLNGKDVAGNTIRVKKAEQKKPKEKANEVKNPQTEAVVPVPKETNKDKTANNGTEQNTAKNPGIWSK